MESAGHRRLKEFGAAMLVRSGCSAVATEVQCPIHRFRLDVAGYVDPAPRRRHGRRPEPGGLFRARHGRAFTCVIECKHSRADFLRDGRDVDALIRLRAEMDEARLEMERTRIRFHEPHLRRSGSSLFIELEEWDFHLSEDREYRKLVGRIERIDRKLHGETKFMRAARYRLADALILLTPPGLIRPAEVPPGWGLVEAEPDTAEARVAVGWPEHQSAERLRQRVLRNIAVAASRRLAGGPLSDAHAGDMNGTSAVGPPCAVAPALALGDSLGRLETAGRHVD